MCSQLGISKAAYYKWLHRSAPRTEQENIELAGIIFEYDDRFNHILGYRRMTAWINRLNGTHFSKNRIHRIMQAVNVHSVIRKKPKKYEKSTPEKTVENILKRNFNASKPNEKWVTDVTEFKWYDGPVCHKLYLSAILDLYDRSVVAYIISRRNDNRLVLHTFDKAIENNPRAKPLLHRCVGRCPKVLIVPSANGIPRDSQCVAHAHHRRFHITFNTMSEVPFDPFLHLLCISDINRRHVQCRKGMANIF